MSGVRVLVGTHKGAFVLTSDGARKRLGGQRPALRGLGGLPRQGVARRPEPAVRVAVRRLVRPGHPALRRRRRNAGTRSATSSATTGRPGRTSGTTARRTRGSSPASGTSSRRSTTPTRSTPGWRTPALFRSTDGGQHWQELPGLRTHSSGPSWQPGAGGMCLHTIILDPSTPTRMYVGDLGRGRIPVSDDAGQTWRPINRGPALRGDPRPRRRGRPLRAPHRDAPVPPDVLFMQKHWDVMRSDDAGETWREVSGNLPTDFGFPIDVHAHEPQTVYVVPITSDSHHFPPEGKLRVYRSRTGGDEWEPLTRGLPQEHCYVNVLRDAMAVDSLERLRHLLRHHRRPGLRLRRRGRQLGADRPRPARRAVGRGPDAAMSEPWPAGEQEAPP